MARRYSVLLVALAVGTTILNCQEHPPQPNLHIFHYDFSISIPDSGRNIAARAVLSLRRIAPAEVLLLDFLTLHIDSLLIDGEPAQFETDPAGVRVTLNSSHRSYPDNL